MVTKKWEDRYALNCPNCTAYPDSSEHRGHKDGISTIIYSCSRCDAFWAVEISDGISHNNTISPMLEAVLNGQKSGG